MMLQSQTGFSLQKLVKGLICVMQKRARHVKWSIDGNHKNVTLTLAWNVQRKLPFLQRSQKHLRRKRKKHKSPPCHNNNKDTLDEKTKALNRQNDLKSGIHSEKTKPCIQPPDLEEQLNCLSEIRRNSSSEDMQDCFHSYYGCNSGISMLEGLTGSTFAHEFIDDVPSADFTHSEAETHNAEIDSITNKCSQSDQTLNTLALPDLVTKPNIEDLLSDNETTYACSLSTNVADGFAVTAFEKTDIGTRSDEKSEGKVTINNNHLDAPQKIISNSADGRSDSFDGKNEQAKETHVYPEIIVQSSDLSASNDSIPVTNSFDDLLKSDSSQDECRSNNEEKKISLSEGNTPNIHHKRASNHKRKQISWYDDPDKCPSPISGHCDRDSESIIHQSKSDTSAEMPEWSDLDTSLYPDDEYDHQRRLLTASPSRIMYVKQTDDQSTTSTFKRKHRYRDSFRKLFPFNKKNKQHKTTMFGPKNETKSNTYVSYDYDSLQSDNSSVRSEHVAPVRRVTHENSYSRVKEYQRIKSHQKTQSLGRSDSFRQKNNIPADSPGTIKANSNDHIPLSVDKCLKTCDKILERHSTLIW